MKTMMIILLTAVLVVVLALTNPGMEEYIAWSSDQAEEDGSLLTEIAFPLIGEDYIKENTHFRNFILCSFYETEYNEQTVKVAGVAGNFFVYGQ